MLYPMQLCFLSIDMFEILGVSPKFAADTIRSKYKEWWAKSLSDLANGKLNFYNNNNNNNYVIQFAGETPPLRIALRWFVIELDRKFLPVIV